MSEETIYFQDSRVTISNSRAILDGKTFAMANITSVSWATEQPKRLWPVAMLVLGGLVAVVGLAVWIAGDSSMLSCTGLAGFVAVIGGLWLFAAKPKHVVVIGSASGESRALVTGDLAQAKRVAAAMNEAIVQRG